MLHFTAAGPDLECAIQEEARGRHVFWDGISQLHGLVTVSGSRRFCLHCLDCETVAQPIDTESELDALNFFC